MSGGFSNSLTRVTLAAPLPCSLAWPAARRENKEGCSSSHRVGGSSPPDQWGHPCRLPRVEGRSDGSVGTREPVTLSESLGAKSADPVVCSIRLSEELRRPGRLAPIRPHPLGGCRPVRRQATPCPRVGMGRRGSGEPSRGSREPPSLPRRSCAAAPGVGEPLSPPPAPGCCAPPGCAAGAASARTHHPSAVGIRGCPCRVARGEVPAQRWG